jgi:prepilin-type N-terminal cleavage/methylation domain-containing protein
MMAARNKYSHGFTIVELLIVIVVIGILAAITIVAYNGIQDRARTSALTGRLTQVAQKIAVWQVDNPGLAPTTLADVGVTNDDASLQLTSDNTANPATYCVTATNGALKYYIGSSNSTPAVGTCTGYNLLAWNKTNPSAPVPVPSATVDTAVFRTSTSSMRIGPASTGRALYGNPYSGTPGQIYSVSLWIKTDSNWDGLANNSKIRFGDATTGALLNSCSYNGVKTTWTQVTCSYALTASSSSVAITVGNDGTMGNIWLDDLVLSRTN